MPLFFSPPPLLGAALPISPGMFMLGMVLSTSVYAVIIVFNLLALKYRSTHRVCVASVVLLLAGLLVANASVGLTFESDSSDLLATLPGKIALGLLVLAATAGLGGFVHCYWFRGKFRRGRKRALGAFVFSLVAIFALIGVSSSSKHPRTRPLPKSRVELLPETDAYGRPLATPTPAPAPATPYPTTPRPSTPARLEIPPPIATPAPARLLPSVLNP